MLDSRIGVAQVNILFSALNAPTVHDSSMRRWEQHVAGPINQAALESCEKAILSEKELTLEFNKKQ